MGVLGRKQPPDGGGFERTILALRRELTAERSTARELSRQLAAEVEFARRAAEEAVKARTEREEYRRVLAAAIANEKRALADVESSRGDTQRTADALGRALLERGEAEGRLHELEARVARDAEEHERRLGQATVRASAEAEARRREVSAAVQGRSHAEGRVRELLGRVPGDVPASARVAHQRARVNVAVAALCTVLAIVFLPATAIALFSGERAQYLELATGLGGWTLLGLELAFALLAVGLGSWGIRELRGVEAAVREARRNEEDAPAGASGVVGNA